MEAQGSRPPSLLPSCCPLSCSAQNSQAHLVDALVRQVHRPDRQRLQQRRALDVSVRVPRHSAVLRDRGPPGVGLPLAVQQVGRLWGAARGGACRGGDNSRLGDLSPSPSSTRKHTSRAEFCLTSRRGLVLLQVFLLLLLLLGRRAGEGNRLRGAERRQAGGRSAGSSLTFPLLPPPLPPLPPPPPLPPFPAAWGFFLLSTSLTGLSSSS